MLKLKKIQILGFKSFCDRTEVTLPGQGIAVVVGPNGCGKSNILDGVTWVLGEQSAKSLRGGKMEDVIFAGTRDRKQLGMAEVSITLIDPEAYIGGPLLGDSEPEVVVENELSPDWDEDKLRADRAAEVEEIIAESQPGQVIEGEAPAETQTAEATNNDGAVVLKIRRRKFQRTPQQGEIVVTPPPLPHRRQRIPAQRQALPPPRHSRHLHGYRPGAGVLRDYRTGAYRAAAQLQTA